METIKINKWNSKKVHYLCDKGDKMDLCFHLDWQKIVIQPSSSEETEDGTEYEFHLDEDTTSELGDWKYNFDVRLNWEGVDKIKVIISNPESDEEDNQD